MKNNKKRVSARRKVIDDAINNTRELAISTELELKYLRTIIETDGDKMSDEQKSAFEGEAKFMEHSIKAHIRKLEFYKDERKELLAKDAMKNYNNFPKTINSKNLEEIEK